MKSKLLFTGICLMSLVTSAMAQTTVTSSGTTATAGNVPYVSAASSTSTTISPSPIAVSGSNVGVGTTAPKAHIDTGALPSMNIPGSFSNAMLNLYSSTGVGDYSQITYGYQPSRTYGAAYTGYVSVNSSGGGFGDLVFGTRSVSTDTQPSERMRITSTGNVGIGTTSPTRKLHIAGDVQIDGNLYFGSSQTPQSAPYAGCTGGDYAESVNVSGDHSKYEPGDVLVIAPDSNGDVVKSTEPYSTLVVGIYSTKPGVVGRRQTGAQTPGEIPMAMLGIVPTKVSAENGPIHRGDLLVTSSTPGYAMKGTDPSRLIGSVVGKALGSLDSGTGVIEVVVTLQ